MLDVLLVEDDEDVRECIASALEDAGHRVIQASDGGRAATLLASRAFDVAIYDVHLPTTDGLTLARRSRHVAPDMAVVVMSSDPGLADGVAGLRGGAVEYLVKPFDPDELAARVLAPIAERRALRDELDEARRQWIGEARARVVSASPKMRALVAKLAAVARSDGSLLIEGEKGSGKRTLARLVHDESARRLGPFKVIPSAALLALLSDAAPGVPDERDRWLRDAEGGTLVLEGVDGLPLDAQKVLAGILGEAEGVVRLDRQGEPRGVRVVATVESDVLRKTAAGSFATALLSRLATYFVSVPPLRERREDLLPLIASILDSFGSTGASLCVEPSARNALASYPFPGNVSELVWALKYAAVMAETVSIDASHLPQRIAGPREASS